MKRLINVSMILLMLVGAISVYTVKNRSERVTHEIDNLRADIEEEEQAIAALKAEWAVLRQPSLLQAQLARHKDQLALEPIQPAQFGSVAELPDRPLTIELLISKSLGDLFEQSEGTVR